MAFAISIPSDMIYDLVSKIRMMIMILVTATAVFTLLITGYLINIMIRPLKSVN